MTNFLSREDFIEDVLFIDTDNDLYIKSWNQDNIEAKKFAIGDINWFSMNFEWNPEMVSSELCITDEENKLYVFTVPAMSYQKVISSLINFLTFKS